jgi:hypothetical protein
VMVINSTKINKTKLHLSPQLTQNKKTTTYYLELGQPKICGGFKPVNEIPTFPLFTIIKIKPVILYMDTSLMFQVNRKNHKTNIFNKNRHCD